MLTTTDLRSRAAEVLASAGFNVSDDSSEFPADLAEPGGACLYVREDQVELYLVTKDGHQAAAADIAAEFLLRNGLSANSLTGTSGDDQRPPIHRSSDALLNGTSTLAECDIPAEYMPRPQQPHIYNQAAVQRASRR